MVSEIDSEDHARISSADGSVTAQIDIVGARLLQLAVGGSTLVESTRSGRPLGAAGALLLPWPNRVRDGRWMLGSEAQQLEISDPSTHNANHGLVLARRFDLHELGQDSITLGLRLADEPGYPFCLDVVVCYSLEKAGVAARLDITNRSSMPAPVAVGFHPYLRVGDVDPAHLVVTVPAAEIIDLDDRYLPIGRRRVGGSDDLRAGVLGSLVPWHASFGGLASTPSGRMEMSLSHDTDAGRRKTTVWADEAFGYAQLYVDRVGGNTSIALEPMTAPPDALRSGHGLHWLGPAATWTLEWGVIATTEAVASS